MHQKAEQFVGRGFRYSVISAISSVTAAISPRRKEAKPPLGGGPAEPQEADAIERRGERPHRQARALLAFLRSVRSRGLSGGPSPEGLQDLFGQRG